MGDITWPAISKGQIIIALGWILAQAVSMNLIDSKTSEALLALGSSVVAFAWFIADSYVRNGRNKAIAAHLAANPGKSLPKSTLVG